MEINNGSGFQVILNERELILIIDEINYLKLCKQIDGDSILYKLGVEIKEKMDLKISTMKLHIDSLTQLKTKYG